LTTAFKSPDIDLTDCKGKISGYQSLEFDTYKHKTLSINAFKKRSKRTLSFPTMKPILLHYSMILM